MGTDGTLFSCDSYLPKWLGQTPLIYRYRYLPVRLNTKDIPCCLQNNFLEKAENILVSIEKNIKGQYNFLVDNKCIGVLTECIFLLDYWIQKGEKYIVTLEDYRRTEQELLSVRASIGLYGTKLFYGLPLNVTHKGQKDNPLNSFLMANHQISIHLENNNVANKTFAFTGHLYAMPQEVAKYFVVQQGGTVKETISKKVNFLVVGTALYDHIENTMVKKANEQKEKGNEIQIISEDDFLRLLGIKNGVQI